MKIAATMKSIIRQRMVDLRCLMFDVPSPETSAFIVGRWTFGVWFICSSLPTLPNRLRARTRQELALPCAVAPLLRGRDRNFAHCNRRRPFSPATTPPEIAAAIHSTDLRSTKARREHDRARTRHPAEHPPK